MKITYVIDSLGYGGAERSIADLVPELIARGHGVSLIQLVDRGAFAVELRDRGVRVETLVSRSRLARVRELRSKLRTDRPDVVHTQLFEADLAGRVAGRSLRVPTVSSMVNVPYGPEHLSRPGYRRSRVRAAQVADIATARLVNRFHAVSQSVASTMSERLRISADRIDVVPRGRSADRLGSASPERRAPPRRALSIAPQRPMILAIGRHEWQKGFDVLVDAVPLIALPEALVLIAGRTGAETGRLHEAIAAANATDRVRLLGARDDIGDLLAAADVLVMPSRHEGLPGTLIEGLALEIPIVASDIGPAREVVGGLGGATLVPAEEPETLAQALTGALEHRPSTNGHRERFESQFSMRAVAQMMESLYRRAAS